MSWHEQLLTLAQHQHETGVPPASRTARWADLLLPGGFGLGPADLEQGIALYDPQHTVLMPLGTWQDLACHVSVMRP